MITLGLLLGNSNYRSSFFITNHPDIKNLTKIKIGSVDYKNLKLTPMKLIKITHTIFNDDDLYHINYISDELINKNGEKFYIYF